MSEITLAIGEVENKMISQMETYDSRHTSLSTP